MDLVLAPELSLSKLCLQYFALEVVHPFHEPLAVGFELVAWCLKHHFESIGFQETQAT